MGVILRILKQGSDKWYRYVKYDDDRYRAIEIATSEAVASVNSPLPSQALSVTLKSNEGLITTKSWYTTTGGGGAKNYLNYVAVKKGSSGSEIKQRGMAYAAHSAGGRTIFKVSEETTYLSETDPLQTSVTSHAYVWYSGTAQVQQKTTSLPIVAEAENGDDQGYSRRSYYDLDGDMTWTQNELGVITGYTYDASTGARKQMVQDVNPAAPANSGLPSGWTSSSTTPLNLITDYEFDEMGRETQVLGPIHGIDLNESPEDIRSARYTVYRDDLFEVRTASGYQEGSDLITINPVSIQKSDASGRTLETIQAKRTGSGRLSSTDTFAQSSYLRWQTQGYNNSGQLSWKRSYYDIPTGPNDPGIKDTNYNEMTYGYDAMGRQNKTVSGGGTINRTVFDTRGLTLQGWVGTDDAGATDSNPEGSGLNNMVEISTQEYDHGNAGGNGNLTRQTQHVSDSEDRVTQFEYDWRDRRIVTDGEENTYHSVTYNNQGQALSNESRAGSASALRLAKFETSYDVLGRAFRSMTYAVDSLGELGNSLVSNTYFDGSGQAIKQSSPGTKAWQKTVFDSLGRATASFTSYPADGTNDGNTNDVSDDIVVEQSESGYDAASNEISSLRFLRFHNAPTTGAGSMGPLVPFPSPPPENTPPYTEAYARIYRSYQWPDAIGRSQASASYGTNNIARPALIPSTSATCLVSRVTYDDAGVIETSRGPQGIVRKNEHDNAGRVVTEIENFILGSSATDANNTKTYAYNRDGALKTLTWINAITGSQVTTWDYGSTRPASGIASSQLLVKKTYPDGGDDHVDYTYNRLGQLLTKTDQNGSVHSYQYSDLGQLTHDQVTTLGADVDGAVRRISNTYDAHQRVESVTSWDNPTTDSGAVVNQVKYAYNAFGQLVADKQAHSSEVVDGTTPQVSYDYADGSDNTVRLNKTTYPSAYEVDIDYGSSGSMDDVLSRPAGVKDASTQFANYKYLGYGTTVIAEYPQPVVELTYLKQGSEPELYGDPYNGLDSFGRIVDQRWIKGATDLERVQYGYTENSLKQWRHNPVATLAGEKEDDLYSYDDLSQIKTRDRGNLNPGKTTISNVVEEEDWTYDPAGNWDNYDHTQSGITPVNQTRTHTKANEIATYNASATPRQYDKAGNMTRLPVGAATTSDYRNATWDAWNRLRRITKTTGSGSSSGTSLDVWYDYDGLTRRTRKRILVGANQGTVSYYYNASWKCLEEFEGGSAPSRRYIYGARGRNDLILRDRDTNGDGTLDQRRYALCDAMGSKTAITDNAGAVTQRYRYQAFGESQVLNPDFTNWTTTDSEDWQTRFHGEQRDAETGYYNYGFRYYLPELGRWPSRDPIGERGGVNLYGMVGNNAVGNVDYLGLFVNQILADLNQIIKDSVRCTITVVVGHGTVNTGANGQPRRDGRHPFNNPFPGTIHDHFRNNPNGVGGGVCYLGCNANALNDRVPEDQQVDGLPDLPENEAGDTGGRWSADDEQMMAAINAAADASAKHAKKFCDKPKCCKFWAVKVQFTGDILDDFPAPDSDGDGVLDGKFAPFGKGHPAVKLRQEIRALSGAIIRFGICDEEK
jgi:RHS repeat-associated protein